MDRGSFYWPKHSGELGGPNDNENTNNPKSEGFNPATANTKRTLQKGKKKASPPQQPQSMVKKLKTLLRKSIPRIKIIL
jgi:hypothetical protein